MSYHISYKIIDDYLKAEITGTASLDSIETVSAISKDVNELVEANGITKILVDTRPVEGRLGIFDSAEYIDSYPPAMKERQYAVIDKPENKEHNNFFENYAINRGFRIYFFNYIDEAEKWLNVENLVEGELVLEKDY